MCTWLLLADREISAHPTDNAERVRICLLTEFILCVLSSGAFIQAMYVCTSEKSGCRCEQGSVLRVLLHTLLCDQSDFVDWFCEIGYIKPGAAGC